MVELYAFQALRTLIKLKWVLVSYQVKCVGFIYYLFFSSICLWPNEADTFTMGLVLLVYVPKMVLTLVLLGEDIFRMGAGSISYFVDYNDNTSF
jgi:hypothetical protein